MIRRPNPEQLKAVEHTGGVLLSAGAGSGKTFVLIEHILYLLELKKSEVIGLERALWDGKLRAYLGSIIMMTFTKKAAGEISLRLIKRLESQLSHIKETHEKESLELAYWELSLDVIGTLSISTIHGFCLKLLKQGFFTNVTSEIEVVSEAEIKKKVEQLFYSWYKEEAKKEGNQTLINIMLSSERSVLSAILGIFMNPDLRIIWKDLDIDSVCTRDLSKHFSEILDLNEISKEARAGLPLGEYSEFEGKTWYDFLTSFNKLTSSTQLTNEESLKSYIDFFDGVKRMPSVRKSSGLDQVIGFFDDIKKFRKFIKDNSESYLNYFNYVDEHYREWLELFKSLFDYIETRYKEKGGVTFSDLEYYVLLGLRNQDTVDLISKQYQYFIVDEFQDTSEVQYDILKSVAREDFSRLFCVGDVKQAIYGFRGGELSVFNDCSKKVETKLEMTHNYRSKENIIFFNNYLFENIFKKGAAYEGTDYHSVPVKYQTSPLEDDFKGDLYQIDVELNKEAQEEGKKAKVSTAEMNYYEALSIKKRISEIQQEDKGRVCVLYKNLGPSKFLINELIKANISFSSQVKIPFSEDPLVSIFYLLVEGEIEKNKNESFFRRMTLLLKCYFRFLDLESDPDKILVSIRDFYSKIKIYGTYQSFEDFCFSLKITNSNHSNNLEKIRDFSLIAKEDMDELWSLLRQSEGAKYSIDFHFGDDSSAVTIMTAHASKGLEFEHIILGGIHTNGRPMIDSPLVGKLPGSFQWKIDSKQKKAFKSPQFIFESLLTKKKDFAESKRLFYVASTRAQNSLSWINLLNQSGDLSGAKDSWVNGIRSWMNDFEDKSKDILKSIADKQSKEEMENLLDERSVKALSLKLPLFHEDSIGLTKRESDGETSLGLISELSVTRLSSLAQCPRKFYLQNLCKIDDDDLKVLELDESTVNIIDEVSKDEALLEEGANSQEKVRVKGSSAQRGTRLHAVLSEAINHNFVLPLSFLDTANPDDINSVNWCLKELEKFKENSELISEIPVKFSFFGQMIAGTPDLVIKSRDEHEIWDFKTGSFSSHKESGYWFQLFIYAYAYGLIDGSSENEVFIMKLAFLDENKIYEKRVSLSIIKESLFRVWKKTGHLYQVNLDHCEYCPFGNLCHQSAAN